MKNKSKKIIAILISIFVCIIISSNSFLITSAQDIQEIYKYSGEIEILSFETLMSFPEKALSENNTYCTQYDETKITTTEFKNILDELYKNNYIIIDIFDTIDKDTLKQKNIYLPQDKKPIILIFNNVSYKSNYQNLGQIDKIILDKNNNLASYTTKKSIQDRIQHDNEFILILENFIKKHKDFSFNNARGIMFFSGENGILGYNTSSKNTSSRYEKKRVSEIIKKLKDLGWRFGANNYTYIDENIKSNMEFAKELSLWNIEIKDIIGETLLYSFSCENYSEIGDEKIELLIKNGFKIFFENSTKSNINIHNDICFFTTKKVNGKNLRNSPNTFNNLFNSQTIYDYGYRLINYPENDISL